MIFRCFRLFTIALITLILAACSNGISLTKHDTEGSADLTTLKTYNWAADSEFTGTSEVAGHNRVFDKIIRNTVNQVLQEKGYVLTDSAQADFSIDYRINIQEEVVATDAAYSQSENDQNINQYGPTWKIGGGSDSGYQGLEPPAEELIFLQKGRLHIGAFAPTNSLVWHTSATKLLNSQKTDIERQQTMQQAVTKVMSSFPAHK